jgi:hypothetical protein
MAITVPALPVLLKLLRRNALILPPVPIPVTGSVVSSPPGVYIKIEDGDAVVISPIPVIIP